MISNANGVVGVGCFAGQPTLSRVLDRMMKAYSLGDWKDAVSAHEKVSPENHRAAKAYLRNVRHEWTARRWQNRRKNRRVLSYL